MTTPATGSIDPVVHPVTGEIRYAVRATIGGIRNRHGIYNTEAEARKRLAVLLDEAKAATTPGGVTLRRWGPVWFRRREADGLHRGVRNERLKWKRIDAWHRAAVPMRSITRQDVVRWVTGLLADGLARGTVLRLFNLLRCSLQDAADAGHVTMNVARDVRVPKVARKDEERTFLTLEELGRLWSVKPPRRSSPYARAILQMVAYTAARPGELWRLRWSDVTLTGDRPEIALRETKAGRPRRVPLLGPALAALRGLPRGIGNALVFPGKGGRQHAEGYDAAWKSWRTAAGVNPRARFYDLRHTAASHLLMGSGHGYPTTPWSMERVSAFLGHSDIKVTQKHYARFVPGWLDGPAREARAEWEARG